MKQTDPMSAATADTSRRGSFGSLPLLSCLLRFFPLLLADGVVLLPHLADDQLADVDNR